MTTLVLDSHIIIWTLVDHEGDSFSYGKLAELIDERDDEVLFSDEIYNEVERNLREYGVPPYWQIIRSSPLEKYLDINVNLNVTYLIELETTIDLMREDPNLKKVRKDYHILALYIDKEGNILISEERDIKELTDYLLEQYSCVRIDARDY